MLEFACRVVNVCVLLPSRTMYTIVDEVLDGKGDERKKRVLLKEIFFVVVWPSLTSIHM